MKWEYRNLVFRLQESHSYSDSMREMENELNLWVRWIGSDRFLQGRP